MSRAGTAVSERPRPSRAGDRFGSVGSLDRWQARPVVRRILSTPFVAGAIAVGMGVFSAQLALTKHPKVALAVFVSLVGGLAVLLEPGIGILAYHGLAYMRPQDTVWGLGGVQLTQTVSLFTIAATALHFALRPDLRFLWRWQTLFVLTLWGMLHVSAMTHTMGTDQKRWLEYYDKLFVIYFTTLALLNSERWLVALAWVLAASIGYLAIWANQQYFFSGWYTVHGPGRPGSTYYDENDFAMVVLMAIPFLWALLWSSRSWILKAACAATGILCAHAIMVTFSRGGFLGMAATGAVLLARMRNRGLAVLIGTLGICGFVLVTGPRYVQRIVSIGDYEEDKSATGRLDSWSTGFKMMMSSPLTGIGFKRYVDAYPDFAKGFAREAHNSWVQLGAECGALAMASHLMLALLTWRAIVRVRRRLPLLPEKSARWSGILCGAYEGCLVGYLVTAFFLSMEDFEFFFLLVAMPQVLDRVTEQRVEESRAAERETAAREPDAGAVPA
jgi:probable O-glycosylation ligase (exosortase A-associated)